MHTPVEMVSYKDIRRTGHLLAQFITGWSLALLMTKYETRINSMIG